MLLVDIGNTCIKWASETNGRLHYAPAVPHHQLISNSFLNRLWSRLTPPDSIWISNVLSEKWEWTIQKWVKQNWNIPVTFVRSDSAWEHLKNGYTVPAQLGVDRWLGLIAVYQQQPTSFCLIGAGTALTIDLVNNNSEHLGGFIVPGWSLSQDILIGETHGCRVDATKTDPLVSAPMPNTSDAITGARIYHYKAMMNQLALDAVLWNDGAPVTFWLTGGDAARMLNLLPKGSICQPYLVLQGLHIWAESLISGKSLARAGHTT